MQQIIPNNSSTLRWFILRLLNINRFARHIRACYMDYYNVVRTLVVNLKTAKALGLKVSLLLLRHAHKIIE